MNQKSIPMEALPEVLPEALPEEPEALPVGGKRKSPVRESPSEPPAKAPKLDPSLEPGPPPLAARQEAERQKLLAKQSQELAALKEKHAKALARFERTCEKEQVNASGRSVCFSCGCPVPGVVQERAYKGQGLPEDVQTTTCCFCALSRKCPACEWSVACAYEPDEHGFCKDCEHEANICGECDGGCTMCQQNNTCCNYNGGRKRW